MICPTLAVPGSCHLWHFVHLQWKTIKVEESSQCKMVIGIYLLQWFYKKCDQSDKILPWITLAVPLLQLHSLLVEGQGPSPPVLYESKQCSPTGIDCARLIDYPGWPEDSMILATSRNELHLPSDTPQVQQEPMGSTLSWERSSFFDRRPCFYFGLQLPSFNNFDCTMLYIDTQ